MLSIRHLAIPVVALSLLATACAEAPGPEGSQTRVSGAVATPRAGGTATRPGAALATPRVGTTTVTGTTAATVLPQAAEIMRTTQRQLQQAQPAMANVTPAQQRQLVDQMANMMAEETDLADELDAATAELAPTQQRAVNDQMQRMQQRMQSMMQVMGAVATPAVAITPGPATAGQLALQMNEMQAMLRRSGAQLSPAQLQEIVSQMSAMAGDMAQTLDTLAQSSANISDTREATILRIATNARTLSQQMLQTVSATAPEVMTTTTNGD